MGNTVERRLDSNAMNAFLAVRFADRGFTIISSSAVRNYVPGFRTNSDKFNHLNGLLCNTLGVRRLLVNPITCPKLVESGRIAI